MVTTIETITVTRPMKVIAFTCCFITTFLMLAAIASTEWMISEKWREGLFEQCIDPDAPMPLPFAGERDIPVPGCGRAHPAVYVRACAALGILVVFTDFFGTILTGLGLRSTDPNKKYKYYRVAIYCLLLCVILLLLILIIYPVSFSKELKDDPSARFDGRTVNPSFGSIDFDKDGILDHIDTDDDNDGIVDGLDKDWDNDGIPNDSDDDDDNDDVPDEYDNWRPYKPIIDDADVDGIPDDEDDDDDNDGIPDSQDGDDDGDGISDDKDNDDDNDGIPDDEDEAQDKKDSDGDGIPDDKDKDDDGDGIPDVNDTMEIDTDGDGVPDSADLDDDGDGVPDINDDDDDGDGIPDSRDSSGKPRTWSYGFGYGVSWVCFILIFLSVVLLICDRESEEIFYKEKQVEDEEEEEEA